jgi:hypothetical protein
MEFLVGLAALSLGLPAAVLFSRWAIERLLGAGFSR